MAIRQTSINSGFGAKTQASEVMAGRDLSGKTTIVTGGYSDLGLETTKALAYAGARAIVTARGPDVARGALLGLDEVEVQALDLVELACVRRFADAFSASRHRADIVINNAGMMTCPETRIGPGREAQFMANHLGHYALVNLLWPSFTDDVRVVAVSSAGYHYSAIHWDDVQFERGYDKWLTYTQSKTANVLSAIQLGALGRGRGVRASVLHSSSIAAPLQYHVPRAKMIALDWMDEAGNPTSPDILKTLQQGAATQLWAVTSPLLVGMGGLYCEDYDTAGVTPDDSRTLAGVREHAIDPEQARRLWKLLAMLTGIDAFAS